MFKAEPDKIAWYFWISPRMEAPQPLWKPLPVSDHPHVRKKKWQKNCLCLNGIFFISPCPLLLAFSLATTEKSLTHFSHLIRYLHTLTRCTSTASSCLFSRRNSSSSWRLLIQEVLHFLNLSPVLDLLLQIHISLVLERPQQDSELQMSPHQCWAEGKDHLPWPAGNALLNAAQDAICHSERVHCWLLVNLSTSTPTLFLQICFPAGWSLLCTGAWVHFSLKCWRASYFPLNFMWFLSARFFCLSSSLWMAAQPCVYQPFVTILYRLKAYIVRAVCSIIQAIDEEVKQYWPQYWPPWGTALVIGLHMDFELLTMTPWAHQFSQFSVHLAVCLGSLYFVNLSECFIGDTESPMKKRLSFFFFQHVLPQNEEYFV